MACVELTITPVEQTALTVKLFGQTVAETSQVVGAQLVVGEACAVISGTIVVLAGSDGPFRTRNGGYFLLNPATNPKRG